MRTKITRRLRQAVFQLPWPIILAVLFSVAFVACGLSKSDRQYAAAHYDEGAGAVDRGDWTTAAQQFQLVVATAGNYKDAASRLATATAHLDDTRRRDARHNADLATASDAADRLAASDQWNDAVAVVQRLVDADPSWPNAHAKLDGMIAQREAYLDRWVAESERLAKAGSWEQAIPAAERVLAVASGHQGAAAHLARARADRADWLDRHYTAGAAAMQDGRIDDAYGEFERVILTEPGFRDIQPRVSDLLWRLSHPIRLASNTVTGRAATSAPPGWNTIDFDDHDWAAPVAAREPSNDKTPRTSDPTAQFVWAAGSSGYSATAFFRYVIELDKTPARATAELNVDDEYELYVNGVRVGLDKDWSTLEKYDLTRSFIAGKNVVAIAGRNRGGDVNLVLALNVDQQQVPLKPEVAQVLTPRPTPTSTVPPTATPTMTATSTPSPTSTPTATPTPEPATFVAQVDRAWAAADWSGAIAALEALRRSAPENASYREKLYGALVNAGQAALASGDKQAAIGRLQQAALLDPARGEATGLLLGLTPTSTATVTPRVPPPSRPATGGTAGIPTSGTGATALCRDGTYSHSAHRQGTCSHHGGVRVWNP